MKQEDIYLHNLFAADDDLIVPENRRPFDDIMSDLYRDMEKERKGWSKKRRDAEQAAIRLWREEKIMAAEIAWDQGKITSAEKNAEIERVMKKNDMAVVFSMQLDALEEEDRKKTEMR